MQIRLWSVAVLLVAVTLAAAVARSEEANPLNGVWTLVSGEMAGEKIPDVDVHLRVVVIKDDTYMTRGTASYLMGGTVASHGKLKFDASQNPKTVDLALKIPNVEAQTQRGIYELQGDTLKLCFNEVDGARPTEFKSATDSHTELMTLKRVPIDQPVKFDDKKPAPIPIPKDETPQAALQRISKTFEQQDVAANVQSYDKADGKLDDYIRADCEYDKTICDIERVVLEKYGRQADEALLHAIGQKSDDDVKNVVVKIDGDKCSFHFPGESEDNNGYMIRVDGIWKYDEKRLLEGLSDDDVKESIRMNRVLTKQLTPLAEKIRRGDFRTFEETVLEFARLNEPPE